MAIRAAVSEAGTQTPECGHDFLVAFSCKGRGLCTSCNARRMAETAAHLVDHVIPPLPVRQWVLSVPKRLLSYLEREPQAVSAVRHSLLRVIEAHLRRSSGGSSPSPALGRSASSTASAPPSTGTSVSIAASLTGSSSQSRKPMMTRKPCAFAPPLT